VTDEPAESDVRKRAAWLLAMLAVVAGLFVLLFTTVLGGSGGSGGGTNQGGPDDSLGPTSAATVVTHSPSRSPSASGSASSSHPGSTSCPTSSACALDGDVGGAVDAINAYRTQHDQKSVPGSVSSAAKKCALANGSGCTGGWAESQVSKPTGAAAVAKISKLGRLLDPSMTSFEVGWAYDPQSKQYYFAIIRND
jgi:hypothetical protein